jgi:hypothetical protein
MVVLGDRDTMFGEMEIVVGDRQGSEHTPRRRYYISGVYRFACCLHSHIVLPLCSGFCYLFLPKKMVPTRLKNRAWPLNYCADHVW